MTADLFVELGIILALVLANALFAGAEIALVTVRTGRLEELADQGVGGARAALKLKHQPERLLATIQVGITVIGATAAAVGGASVAERLAPLIARVDWLREQADEIALGIVIALVSYLSIVLGELVPKSIALRSAEPFALLVARPLLALSSLVRPIVTFLTMSSNVVLKPFGDRTTFAETRYSAEEIQQLVEDAKKSGSLHPDAADIASRALVFPDLTASEVMVPRHQLVMLPLAAPMAEIHRIIIARPHTRLPVYDESPDDVVGYVNIKDLATRSWERGDISLQEVMRPPHFVPTSKLAGDLLSEMRRLHVPISIVIEEQGGLAGLITIEDLLEELVGTIETEHAKEAPPYVREREGSWVVSGSLPIRELNRELNLDLPEEGDWNTLAGLFIHQAGRIPKAGEQERLPDGTVLEVLEASPRRIRTLRVKAPEGHAELQASAS
ncbi:MAG TPA: hemolysin family protein [Polyangiales bacterium]|jgi:putative hemolysin|nr:hemolysin family protein [Polyangiales bacterium]